MQDSAQLAASYEHCRNIAKTAARNFYYGFALLPPEKRDALCALYAFMRRADVIADSNGGSKDKSAGLDAWQSALDRALGGEYNGSRILPAFHHTVAHYQIPASYFHDMFSGARMDLNV